MSERKRKSFDCVESMRDARDRLSAEIGELKYDDLVAWLRSRRYSDPVLQRLAEKAGQQAVAAAGASRRR